MTLSLLKKNVTLKRNLKVMAKKNNNIVYSTDPNWQKEEPEEEMVEEVSSDKQNLRIELLRLKGNKLATVVTQFQGSEDALTDLCKTLKQLCGVGGSVKEGEIQLQGDVRVKIEAYFEKQGYKFKRKGG